MRFARVCASWCGAVEVGRELVVEDTKIAERRAKSLMKGRAERRGRIRSLSINIEAVGARSGKRVASLVSACPQLETLQLLGFGSASLGTTADELAKPLSEALKTLSKMKHFFFNTTHHLSMSVVDFFRRVDFLAK